MNAVNWSGWTKKKLTSPMGESNSSQSRIDYSCNSYSWTFALFWPRKLFSYATCEILYGNPPL
jgi:hypothetical protein